MGMDVAVVVTAIMVIEEDTVTITLHTVLVIMEIPQILRNIIMCQTHIKSSKGIRNLCYRCDMMGHWSRTCRILKYLANYTKLDKKKRGKTWK